MFNFKMNGRNWTIEEKLQQEIKTFNNERRANENENIKSVIPRYYGVTYVDVQKIYLDKDLPIDRKRQVLIHELTHCYISEYITHSEKQYDEEDVADINSNAFEIIQDILDKYFDNEGGKLEWNLKKHMKH